MHEHEDADKISISSVNWILIGSVRETPVLAPASVRLSVLSPMRITGVSKKSESFGLSSSEHEVPMEIKAIEKIRNR